MLSPKGGRPGKGWGLDLLLLPESQVFDKEQCNEYVTYAFLGRPTEGLFAST